MTYQFSLAHLTALGCTPAELTVIAARAGYDFVSLRLIPMGVPGESDFVLEDKGMIRKTRDALNETGIKLLDIELARITADIDPQAYVPAMETAAELGGRHVISSAWATAPIERDVIVERYAQICDLADPFGLTVDLEFPTFSLLTSLQEAADIVRASGCHNGGILIDTLYIHFSGVDLDELSALPPEWFHFMHICDTAQGVPTTREGLIHIARDERLYVGEGCIDFTAIFDHLPSMPLSIELPNAKQVGELGVEGHARRCLETAKQYLENNRSNR